MQQFARLLHVRRVQFDLARALEGAHAHHHLFLLHAQPFGDGGNDDTALFVISLQRRAHIRQGEEGAAHDDGGIDGKRSYLCDRHSTPHYSRLAAQGKGEANNGAN